MNAWAKHRSCSSVVLGSSLASTMASFYAVTPLSPRSFESAFAVVSDDVSSSFVVSAESSSSPPHATAARPTTTAHIHTAIRERVTPKSPPV